jgi:Cu(I)/Ag(I) efflux system membrane fusion protein
MKATHFILIVIIAAAAAAGGWFAARKTAHNHDAPANSGAGGRKVLFYQSSMHPWIKSDKPGKCTICGMDLAPVYEGDKGFDTAAGVTSLSSNTITVINVQTESVRRQKLQRTLRVAGTIDDNDAKHRRLAAYVEGRIDRLYVNYQGAEVVAGQPLAAYYSPMLLAAEREYLTLLQQKLPATSASFQGEQQRMISSAVLRLKRLGYDDAQIVALETKTLTNSLTEILAPISGTVVNRAVYEGQYVKEGELLFELADFSTMWFKFDAYERDLAWIKPGTKVEITTPAVPGKSYQGTVAFLDPNLSDMSRSAKVRVELTNPLIEENGVKRRELLHKLYAEAEVLVEIPEVLAVPRSAVLSPGPQPVVYVDLGSGNDQQRRVKLGRLGDDLAEVLDGLKEGEPVVTTGNLLIDAQAQLNQSAQSPEAPAPATPALPPLNDEQQQTTTQFLNVMNAVAQALAGDNLEGFNQASAKLHEAVPALTKAFGGAPAWQPLIAAIEKSGHLPKPADLAAARKAFHPLTTATVAFTKAVRQQKPFATVKIFTCPMINEAFPGAPKDGFWVQLEGPLRNPYFGKEMLDCGSEVKP